MAIFITIFFGLIYQICLKSMSGMPNPILALVFTYISSLIGLLFVLIFYDTGKVSILDSFSYTSVMLGLSIVGIEIGVLLTYRSGWNINIAPIIVTIGITLLLIPIGTYLFHESFSISRGIGILFCIVGVLIINLL